MVVIVLVTASTRRTRLLSPIKMFPERSKAMPSGKYSSAAVANPPSPQGVIRLAHPVPLPATVVIIPVSASHRRMRRSSVSAML